MMYCCGRCGKRTSSTEPILPACPCGSTRFTPALESEFEDEIREFDAAVREQLTADTQIPDLAGRSVTDQKGRPNGQVINVDTGGGFA
jgi:predicted  nucleic acid-binding Zn-ribbon protein